MLDRIQTQEEIALLLEEVFSAKKRINFEEYQRINTEVTSEMFLAVRRYAIRVIDLPMIFVFVFLHIFYFIEHIGVMGTMSKSKLYLT